MPDVKTPKTIPCKFDHGRCGKPTDNGLCTRHSKTRCVSCGKQATQSCDHPMGGLVCGSPLCGTCKHVDDKHVTRSVASRIHRQKKAEEDAKVASRKSKEQRIDPKLNIPMNLFELLKGDWKSKGWILSKIYLMELEHGLMGFFPALVASCDKRVVITTDLRLLEKVWKIIEPVSARLSCHVAYVNEDLVFAYVDESDQYDRENSGPLPILNEVEFKELSDDKEPFVWAPGLLGGSSMSRSDFNKLMREQAHDLDPSFEA